MSLAITHERLDVKSHPDNRRWFPVEHEWTSDELATALEAATEDGSGPLLAPLYGTRAVSKNWHRFSQDIGPFKKGDRLVVTRSRR